MLTQEMKDYIDTQSLEDLLYTWRFSTPGDGLLQGDTGEYFMKVMCAKRDADPEEWARVNKEIWWPSR